jgi:cell division protein FtsN
MKWISVAVTFSLFFGSAPLVHGQPRDARALDNADRCIQLKELTHRSLIPGYVFPSVVNDCPFPVQAIACFSVVDARGEVNQSLPTSCRGNIGMLGFVIEGKTPQAQVVDAGKATMQAGHGGKSPLRKREGFVVACPVKDPANEGRWVHMRNFSRDSTGAMTVQCSSETSKPVTHHGDRTIDVSSTGPAGSPRAAFDSRVEQGNLPPANSAATPAAPPSPAIQNPRSTSPAVAGPAPIGSGPMRSFRPNLENATFVASAGLYRTERQAQAVVRELLKFDVRSQIAKMQAMSQTFYRVQIPAKTEEEAKEHETKIRHAGHSESSIVYGTPEFPDLGAGVITATIQRVEEGRIRVRVEQATNELHATYGSNWPFAVEDPKILSNLSSGERVRLLVHRGSKVFALEKLGGDIQGPAAQGKSDQFLYFLQAGAFRTSHDADAQRKALAAQGVESTISEREQAGQQVFRVRIGPFSTVEDAERNRAKLDNMGMQSALVRVQQ